MRKAEEQSSQPPDSKGMETTLSLNGVLLGPGGQIASFRIEQELGRGAMGVVYLARDTRLDRPVAIKSLPAELLEDTTARTLFTREARVLASLNHPNIATIYEELQEAEGVGYLVLEYIPGKTLGEYSGRAKLKQEEALSIAQQIAEAVAAAHEHKIIHRDLKPGNIKITPDGRIKVLDFGLAKAVGARVTDPKSTVTEPGRIMGTPAYMSPEQARGQEVDERCDIWAFGCVLYEMLTGRVPFKGETVSDTLAAILDREPDWDALPETTPANIRVLLRRCLQKDRRRRLHDIVDAVLEISETLSGALETVTLPINHAPVSRSYRRNVILGALTCLIAGMLVVGFAAKYLLKPEPPTPRRVQRLTIDVPPDGPLYSGRAPNSFLAISPDGTRLVYVGKYDETDHQLYMRSMDDLHIKPIALTKNAHNPFFSPDSQWVGFFTGTQLKRVSVVGGEPSTLYDNVDMGQVAFGSWGRDDSIVFSVGGAKPGLKRLPAKRDEQVETLVSVTPEDSETDYRYPQILPGGEAVLYTRISRSSRIEAFRFETGTSKVVLNNASYATYVNSGHLIFLQDHVLSAVPFDVKQLETIGDVVRLDTDNVGFDWTAETPQITVSTNGTAVYISGSEDHKQERKGELVWVDRQGTVTSLNAPAKAYEGPRVSPEGNLIAVGIRSVREGNEQKEGDIQVQVYNVELDTFIPLTTEGESRWPQWSPHGNEIAFWGWAHRAEEAAMFSKVVGASAPADRLADKPPTGAFLHPYDWSNDLLACTVLDPKTQEDIWIVDLKTGREPKRLINTEDREYNPTFSTDCNWLAYVSERSDQSTIYLLEYPNGEQRWPVPTPGATNPVWSRDGKELYYISGQSMMAVKITSDAGFPIGKPEPLFESSDLVVSGGEFGRAYDVADDGRFLMIRRSKDAKDKLICVDHWFEELKRLAPPREK